MLFVKKYKLDRTEVLHFEGKPLYRIEALVDLELASGETILAQTKGGWLEKEANLDQSGSCWIFPGAKVLIKL